MMSEEYGNLGSEKQDLNRYKCPDCGSPFFKRGRDSYLDFVQCLKPNCKRRDIIGPNMFPAVLKSVN